MASKPIGTMYAEIDLNMTKAEANLARLHKTLVDGTVKVEDAYKSLGIKSDRYYENQRRTAQAAVDFIKNKTISSLEEIQRAEKAAASKIAKIDEEQFGKRVSTLNALKSHWLAVSAAIAAGMVTASKIWDMAKAGASFDEQAGFLDNLAKKYKTTADTIISEMDRASKYQVAKSELMSLS